MNKINTYEFGITKRPIRVKAKTLIQATKKLNLDKRKIELGMLIRVKVNGVNMYWDSRQFIKHANLTIVTDGISKENKS